MDLDRIFRTLPNFQNLTPRHLDISLEIIRNNSIETRFVRTRGVGGGRGARIRKINHPVRFDRILTPSWRERERERGRRGGRGGEGSVPLSPRANYSPSFVPSVAVEVAV